jgi:hypothetical protein
MIKIDKWVGDSLFIPIIIRICQMANLTQYRFARFSFMFAYWILLLGGNTWGWFFPFLLLMTLAVTIAAMVLGDGPRHSSFLGRMLFLFVGLADIGSAVFLMALTDTNLLRIGMLFWIFILAAEYASTIRTIPPLENTSRKLARETS